MRNIKKIAGIIALIAIMGLVAACGGGGGSSTTPGGTVRELSGTYYGADGRSSIEFDNGNALVIGYDGSGIGFGMPIAAGTYTISGNTVTVTCTRVLFPVPDVAVGDVYHFRIINDTTLLNVEENQNFTKR